MGKLIAIVIFSILFVLIDLYVYQAVKTSINGLSSGWKKFFFVLFWGITAFSIISLVIINTVDLEPISKNLRRFLMVVLVIIYFSKIFGVVTLLLDDIYNAGVWVYHKFFPLSEAQAPKPGDMPRSKFIATTALAAMAVPVSAMGFGIISGAHNYRLRKRTVYLPNLPAAFDGIRIGQLSDIHTGSFFNRKAVHRGIELFMTEKPDVVFFTGDLVNDVATEVGEYKDILSRVKAPLGVYSTLGNHDYGDYKGWSNPDLKRKNLADLIQVHHEMGWDILMNENRTLKVDGEEIAILGIENWGAGRFSKYGKLDEAYKGIEDKPVKLLLSHDPSHWDAQVRKEYEDIDMMFAGHTHGFQFGVEIANFKWSPSKYIYKQWADLYHEGNQYLYVNRGFGFLGYPGRIGIMPEVTIIELKKGQA
ncbi:MAG: metallophosphoesterase [Cyclobacteriaceae bacterium]|nr:metallophosphoesterase [Cyclobacteriaceae bacterium]